MTCENQFLGNAGDNHRGNLCHQHLAAPWAQPLESTHDLGDIQHTDARIGEHRVMRHVDAHQLHGLARHRCPTSLSGGATRGGAERGVAQSRRATIGRREGTWSRLELLSP